MSHALGDEVNTVALLRKNSTISTKVAILVTLLHCDTEACQVGPLAAMLGTSTAVVSMVGDTLERAKHVERCYPADDLRKAILALTIEGRKEAKEHLRLLRILGTKTQVL